MRLAKMFWILLFAPLQAGAVLTIEITEGLEAALPIAVAPFAAEGGVSPPEDVAEIVAADLQHSGHFAPLARDRLPAADTRGAQVDMAPWRGRGVENLVTGRVSAGAGDYDVEFRLFDVVQGTQLVARSYSVPPSRLRAVAHQISDVIYETLTGERGAFSTRIAYVTVTRETDRVSRYELQVADADGYNPQTILISREPLLSPAWSPDGRRLAYVSLENRHAEVFIQEVATGARRKLAAYPGLNSAPAWSPDGRSMALTLSKDGNPEIYVLNLASGALRRITDNLAIDTEAAWSPDGRSLVFTSDRGGSPQLYRVSVNGGVPERILFEGDYNARASYSPDGRRLALIHGERGRYRIAVLDLDTRSVRTLTETSLDETPSFAPNGSMVLYASRAAVSVDGRVKQRIALAEGDVREPAWSPFSS